MPHNYRAIDFIALVGSIGGYIGLFMGFSLLQFIDFIQLQFKKYLKKRGKDVSTGIKNTTDFHVKAALSENIDYNSKTTNPIASVLRIIQSELEHITQRVEAIEHFILKSNVKTEELVKRDNECK